MKRLFVLAMMAVMCVGLKAQFREGDLQGYFVTENYSDDTNWHFPKSIRFEKGGTCIYDDDRGTLECCGYILVYDGYLHLFSKYDFRGDLGITMINLRCGGTFVTGDSWDNYNTWIRLSHYTDNGKWVEMRMIDKPSDVRSTARKEHTGDAKFNLNGVKTESPKDIYIQGGKKKVVK